MVLHPLTTPTAQRDSSYFVGPAADITPDTHSTRNIATPNAAHVHHLSSYGIFYKSKLQLRLNEPMDFVYGTCSDLHQRSQFNCA